MPHDRPNSDRRDNEANSTGWCRKRGRTLHRALLIAYVGVIFALIPCAPELWKLLYARCGPIFLSIVPLVGIAFFCLLAIVLIRVRGARAIKDLLVAVGTFLCYLLLFRFVTQTPLEQFHLIEYSLLSYLVYHSLSPRSFMKTLIPGLLIVTTVGLADECCQWLSPHRFCDMRDVLLNTASGMLGFLLIGLLRGSTSPSYRKETTI